MLVSNELRVARGLGGPKILAPLSCALTIGALLDTSKYKKVSCSEPLDVTILLPRYHFDPPPTILAYLEKAEYTFWHPHDGRIAAQLSRIVYLKQVHHLGCPSARKCGILCFSA